MLPSVTKKVHPSEEVLAFLKKIGSKGGKTRAKKYGAETFRQWAIESGAGRPRKHKTKGEPASTMGRKARASRRSKKEAL